MRLKLSILLAVSASCLLQGALLTTNTIPSPTVIDFNQFAGTGYNFTAGPVQVGGSVGLDVVFSSTTGNTVLGEGSYGLDANGFWVNGAGGAYVGLNATTASVLFVFNGFTASAVGGFFNYAPGYGDATIEVLDSSLAVLETYVLNIDAPISTPGGSDAGEFRGISRGTADIAAFRISNAYIVMDNLTFNVNASEVPEPATSALFAAGVAALALFRRRSS